MSSAKPIAASQEPEAALRAARAIRLSGVMAGYGERVALDTVDLETWVRDRMTTVPDENRRVVSFHEAFPYFAAAYGLE
ncbi:MAG: metal ABC transporter substrate-binding protein, partial [Chloroflexota bacterium]|nr:metal ABC transporter substrate-binding protein [Chloroflexota bacterium]